MSFEDPRDMLQSVIDNSIDRFVALSGGCFGAMIGLHIGTRVFVKIVPKDGDDNGDEKSFDWTNLALAAGVMAAFTAGGAVVGAKIAARMIENV